MSSLLSDKFTSGEFVVLFPAYAAFFEELIYAHPQILVQQSDALKSLCVKMVNLGIDQSFFTIVGAVFEKLSLEDLKSSGWLNFQVASVLSVINGAPKDNPEKSYKPLYFKEFVFLLMKFGLKHNFAGRSL